MPPLRLLNPESNPKKSVLLLLPELKSLKCVRSFMLPPTEILNIFSFGTSFVFIRMKPPLKSDGYCGDGDFTTTMLSSCEDGIISKEKALESASELGTALLFIQTLL